MKKNFKILIPNRNKEHASTIGSFDSFHIIDLSSLNVEPTVRIIEDKKLTWRIIKLQKTIKKKEN